MSNAWETKHNISQLVSLYLFNHTETQRREGILMINIYFNQSIFIMFCHDIFKKVSGKKYRQHHVALSLHDTEWKFSEANQNIIEICYVEQMIVNKKYLTKLFQHVFIFHLLQKPMLICITSWYDTQHTITHCRKNEWPAYQFILHL